MAVGHGLAYAVLVILNAGLVVFAQQLATGAVPLPQEWQWVVPIAVAMVTALAALLPRVGEPRGPGAN